MMLQRTRTTSGVMTSRRGGPGSWDSLFSRRSTFDAIVNVAMLCRARLIRMTTRVAESSSHKTFQPWVRERLRRADDVERDRGAVMFWVVPIMVGLIAMAGLIVDGGNAIAAREQAADVAQQAARAGADALSPTALHDSDPADLSANPGAARVAAQRVLDTAGISNPTVVVSGDSVTVSVTVHEKTQILSAFGLNNISGSASSTAVALHGSNTGGTG